MAKKYLIFFIFFICVSVLVQHIQIHREREIGRENWRQFTLQLEADRAHAAFVLALAPATKYVLASLVAGTTAAWCYMNGGKEAWIQFTGAMNDGVQVTKAWIQEKIAQNKGIDTSPSGDMLDSAGGFVVYSGSRYELGSSQGTAVWSGQIQLGYPSAFFGGPGGTHANYYSGAHSIYIKRNLVWTNGVIYDWNYEHRWITSVSPSAGGFDPADYPELYTGPALLENCHQVAQQNPDMWLLYPPPTSTAPSSYDPTKTIQVPIAARLSDGSLVDQSGRKLPPPPPGIVPDLINPPTLAPDLIGGVEIDWSQHPDHPGYLDNITSPVSDVVIPKTLSDLLGSLGITGPIKGTIEVAGQKSIVWTNAQGEVVATPVDAAIAAQLSPVLPPPAIPVAGAPSLINPFQPELDPGEPNDPNWGYDTALFDPNFDWGGNSTFSVVDHIRIVKALPFVNLVEGSTFQILQPSSQIVLPIDFPGIGETEITFDFADYEWLYNIMGPIIYFFALLHSIAMAFHLRIGG